MCIKCTNNNCKYFKGVFKSRSARQHPFDKKSGGHCKFGRKQQSMVSGRCILGEYKRRAYCPL
jgi:hypothetical protein